MSEREELIAWVEGLEGAMGFAGNADEAEKLHKVRLLLRRDEEAMREAVKAAHRSVEFCEAVTYHTQKWGNRSNFPEPGFGFARDARAAISKLTEALK